MSPGWVLREGRADDVEAMFRLDLLCFEETFRFSRRAMRRFASERGAVVMVGEEQGQLAGFVIVNLQREGTETLAYVTTLDVAPEWRRQGLAKALMGEAEVRARAAGAFCVMLHVFTGNVTAVAFYERCGYLRLGAEADFYGAGLDGLLYRKGL